MKKHKLTRKRVTKKKERKNNRIIRYKGKEKYHFRRNKRAKMHPAIIIKFTKKGVDAFQLTRSPKLRKDNNQPKAIYILLHQNPDGSNRDSYVLKVKLKNRQVDEFTEPLEGYKLSKEDEKLINELVRKSYKH